jgi:hypothetical protein
MWKLQALHWLLDNLCKQWELFPFAAAPPPPVPPSPFPSVYDLSTTLRRFGRPSSVASLSTCYSNICLRFDTLQGRPFLQCHTWHTSTLTSFGTNTLQAPERSFNLSKCNDNYIWLVFGCAVNQNNFLFRILIDCTPKKLVIVTDATGYNTKKKF